MTASTAVRLPGCPEWCTDHDYDPVDGSGCHWGQEFGEFAIRPVLVAERSGEVRASTSIQFDHMNLTADDLRTLAAEAVKAAEWLEAQS